MDTLGSAFFPLYCRCPVGSNPSCLFQNYLYHHYHLLRCPMGSWLLSRFSFSASEVGAEEIKASEKPKIGEGPWDDESTLCNWNWTEEWRETVCLCSVALLSNHKGGSTGKGAHSHLSFIHTASIYSTLDMNQGHGLWVGDTVTSETNEVLVPRKLRVKLGRWTLITRG